MEMSRKKSKESYANKVSGDLGASQKAMNDFKFNLGEIHVLDIPIPNRKAQTTMTSFLRDWAGLPEHILDLIVTKFGPLALSDYFCFSAICTQWRNVMKLNPSLNIFFHTLKQSCTLPMLMIKTDKNHDEMRGLYNVLNGITYKVKLPLPYNYRFLGSSHGWLLCVDENLVITLLDPFNNGYISLPSFGYALQELNKKQNIDRFDYYIQKALLTSDPHTNPNDYKVVINYDSKSKLAYYEPDQHRWKFIILEPEEDYCTADVIYYDNCIYSVTYFGELVRFDFQRGFSKKRAGLAPYKKQENGASSFYLVESQDGNLLLVERFCIYDDFNSPITFELKVFKYCRAHCYKCFGAWKKIDNIGEQALFVGGTTHSVSVSTIKCSEFIPNSIYYINRDRMDDASYEYRGFKENSDLGIFDLKYKSFGFHHVLGRSEKYQKPAIWFVPNLKIK